ncbi:MAG: Rid family hydrolase [Terrimicrobiaceae bacterium]|jgi:2-iminobutanoate/2-iminopropanoate deaminase|nr:Rid family hydrolase [Terrimicrobiaceae bacterium]
MKTLISGVPDGPKAIGPYSLGVVAEGRFVFVSGMTPFNPATGKLERGSVGEQTVLVLENIKKVLGASGASLADVVSCRVYLANLTPETFQEMNDVYARYFGDSLPARATAGAQLLGFDVEIECVAALPGEKSSI